MMTAIPSQRNTTKSSSAARLAISVMFFVNGFVFASWLPHIPALKHRVGLSDGILGLALLALGLGAMVAMPLSGRLIARFGSRPVTVSTGILFCAALPLTVVADRFAFLVAALFLFGAFTGAMDVAMNTHGIAVEKRYGRPIMSSLHGLYSIGGFAGAAVAGIAIFLGVYPIAHTVTLSVPLVAAVLVASRHLLPATEDSASPGTHFAWPRGILFGIGLLAFFGLVAEGAMADWSAVYLHDTLGASGAVAALGFSAFSLAMAVGRFTGDRIVHRFGDIPVMRTGAFLAFGGMLVALLVEHPALAIAGLACVGLGLANIVPLLFRAASQVPGFAPGAGIAAVATLGYLGGLLGPPLIGFAAELITLTGALGLVAICIGFIGIAVRLATSVPSRPQASCKEFV